MKPSEAAVLLTKAAAFDNRNPSKEAATAWADAMTRADVHLPDALEAVSQHFTESTDYLVPAEIIKRVKATRRQRLIDAGQPDYPNGLDQVRERDYAKAWRRAIGQGMTRDEATAHVDRQGGIVREIERPRPVAELLAGSGFGKSVAS